MNPSLPLKNHLWLIAVLSVGVLILAFGVDVRMTGEAGVIATDLPQQVGVWQGKQQRFCLGKGCGRKFVGEECRDLTSCPDCGSPVNNMSQSEYRVLPKDTILHRRMYHHPLGRTVLAAIVLSGRQRSSLHRPELCLTLTGSEIAGTHAIALPLADESVLRVRVLDLVTTVPGPDGRPVQMGSYYAYWFSGKDRRTPHHLVRMFLMAMDKILYSKIDRWAYVSVGGARDLTTTDHLDEIRGFIQEFYPLIEAADEPPADSEPVETHP